MDVGKQKTFGFSGPVACLGSVRRVQSKRRGRVERKRAEWKSKKIIMIGGTERSSCYLALIIATFDIVQSSVAIYRARSTSLTMSLVGCWIEAKR